MIKVRNLIALGTVVFVGALAACGGGGGGGSSVPGTTGTNTGTNTGGGGITLGANQAVAQFSITIPAGSSSSSSSRRAQYVAPGTQSITLTLLQNNGNPVSPAVVQGPFNLYAGATGCSAVGVSPVTCTFQIAAPAGNDVYLANTYSAPNAQGPLGSGAVALSVVLNTTNQANLTLTGPVQSVLVVSNNGAFSDALWNGVGYFWPITWTQYNSDAVARRSAPQVLASSAPTPTPTAPSSERLYVIAEDANGDQILNPTTYNQPIILTTTFTNTGCCGIYSGPANVLLTNTSPVGTPQSQSGSTVQVFSPSDVTTASLIQTIFSPEYCCGYLYVNFAFITASLASPPPGFTPYTLNVTAEVVPTPSPTPSPVPTGSPVPTPSPSPTGYIQVIGS